MARNLVTRLGAIILSLLVVELARRPLSAVMLLRLISIMPARRLCIIVWLARLLEAISILTQSPRGIRVILIPIPFVLIRVVVLLTRLWGIQPTILSRRMGLLFMVLTVVVQLTFRHEAFGTFVDTVPPTTPTSVWMAMVLICALFVPWSVVFVLVVARVIVLGLA